MSGSTSSRPRSGRAEVVLFHSALGLRPAVREWAERLRAAGHTVHAPDLYGGRQFDDIPTAMGYVEEIGGIQTLIVRTQASVEALPRELVYAGFSNGAASAELLAGTRAGARGAILMHGALPIEAFGLTEWPASVPVQLHGMLDDPYRQQADIEAFAAAVRRSGAVVEQYDYPGSGHLFADRELPDHDESAAALMLDRVLDALERFAVETAGSGAAARR